MKLANLTRSSPRRPSGPRPRRTRRELFEHGDRVGNRLFRSPLRWFIAVFLGGMLVMGEYFRTFDVEFIRHGWYPSPVVQALLAVVIVLPMVVLALFARTRANRCIGTSVLLGGSLFHLVNGSTPMLALISIGLSCGALCLAGTGPEVRR
jgi:hypothetical protein